VHVLMTPPAWMGTRTGNSFSPAVRVRPPLPALFAPIIRPLYHLSINIPPVFLHCSHIV